MAQRIAVIDYGMGNLRSVAKALEHVAPDAEVVVSADAAVIDSAERIVCPGQGAAADCMLALRASGMDKVVLKTIDTRPFLGICMGLQVLLTHSDENGGVDCLDVIKGCVKRLADPAPGKGELPSVDGPLAGAQQRRKVPHMGWSQVRHRRSHALWQGIEDAAHFYFAHSFHCVPDDARVVVGDCDYGGRIDVALARPGLFACQFHPEKSARDGLRLLRNFTRWQGN